MSNYIARLKLAGRNGYANSIQQTLDLMKKFAPVENLGFKQVNYQFLSQFQQLYASRGHSVNTLNLHFRNMRTVFNDAINSDYIDQGLYPFRKFKIKKAATKSRNLNLKEIATLLKAVPRIKAEEEARDLFMLSFYLLGVNMIDLVTAEKSQIERGRFYYTRAKTKKPYSIKIFPEAQGIIDKYKGENGCLLRFIEDKKRNQKKCDRKTPLYKDITDYANKKLKDLGKSCGLGNSLSSYYARHSWASIADELEIPKTVISTALGHSTNSVTDTYIATDLNRVDEANGKIIQKLQDILLE